MTQKNHLTETEILQAVAGAEDVPESIRRHLNICSSCKQEAEQLRDDLNRVGQLSRDLAPVPSRPVRLPVREEKHSSRPSWQIAFAASLATGLVLILVLWITPMRIPFESGRPPSISKAWEDDLLMREIRTLEENPLSPFHRFVIGGTSLSPGDEFMDFVSPALGRNVM